MALHLTTLEMKNLRNVLGKINDRMFSKNNPKRPKTKIGGEEEEQKTKMGTYSYIDGLFWQKNLPS